MRKDLELLDKLNNWTDSKKEEQYQVNHRPPSKQYGAPLYDLTKIYPKDVYENMMSYASDFSQKDAAFKIIKYKNKPNALVQIYRSVPKGVELINPGDWVAITKNYAVQHGKHPTDENEDQIVVSAKVLAKDLYTDGNSFEEWGYTGEASIKGVVV